LIKRGVGDYLTRGRSDQGDAVMAAVTVSTIRSVAAGRTCGDALSVIGQMLSPKLQNLVAGSN
jgi:hypothetical protein